MPGKVSRSEQVFRAPEGTVKSIFVYVSPDLGCERWLCTASGVPSALVRQPLCCRFSLCLSPGFLLCFSLARVCGELPFVSFPPIPYLYVEVGLVRAWLNSGACSQIVLCC